MRFEVSERRETLSRSRWVGRCRSGHSTNTMQTATTCRRRRPRGTATQAEGERALVLRSTAHGASRIAHRGRTKDGGRRWRRSRRGPRGNCANGALSATMVPWLPASSAVPHTHPRGPRTVPAVIRQNVRVISSRVPNLAVGRPGRAALAAFLLAGSELSDLTRAKPRKTSND